MKFTNLNDLKRYVEKSLERELPKIGKELEKQTREITLDEQLKYEPESYIRTWQLEKSATLTKATNNEIEITWEDMNWESGFYAPYGLENGTTRGKNRKRRPKTYFVKKSTSNMKNIVPKELKKRMRNRGIPIK